MIELKTIMTTPEETSVISDGTPLPIIPAIRPGLGAVRTGLNRLRRKIKWGERIRRLMTGARPVAKTAPKIPIPQGKMNTQSRTMLERLPPIIPAIASPGAPSLRTKQRMRLLSINAGANRRITCR